MDSFSLFFYHFFFIPFPPFCFCLFLSVLFLFCFCFCLFGLYTSKLETSSAVTTCSHDYMHLQECVVNSCFFVYEMPKVFIELKDIYIERENYIDTIFQRPFQFTVQISESRINMRTGDLLAILIRIFLRGVFPKVKVTTSSYIKTKMANHRLD